MTEHDDIDYDFIDIDQPTLPPDHVFTEADYAISIRMDNVFNDEQEELSILYGESYDQVNDFITTDARNLRFNIKDALDYV